MKTKKQIENKIRQMQKGLDKVEDKMNKLIKSGLNDPEKSEELDELWKFYYDTKMALIWVLSDGK